VTSDIGRPTEVELLRSGSLACDVLVVPHHGSRHSACAAWLDRCDPAAALIPAGPLNRYNHPHQEVLGRLEARDIPYRYPKRDGRCGARLIDDRWVLYP
jgi:competence protein ComEC